LGNAYAKLLKWAAPKGLLKEDSKMATIYHDSYKITEPEKVRMSACLILNEKTEVSGEIGLTTIEKGKCIVGHFEIGIHEFEKSWTGLFIWMNENGYKKADWSKAEADFKRYSQGEYNRFKDQFTEEERERIDNLTGQYYAMLAKYKTNQLKGELKSIMNKAKGMFEELKKE